MYKSPTRRRLRLAATAVLGLALVAGTTAYAQQKPLPIRIESNDADLSQQDGVSTYTGNVVLTRGGLTLTGYKLVITRINDRGNVKAVLNGSPAKLDKQPDREGDDVVTGNGGFDTLLGGSGAGADSGDTVESNAPNEIDEFFSFVTPDWVDAV